MSFRFFLLSVLEIDKSLLPVNCSKASFSITGNLKFIDAVKKLTQNCAKHSQLTKKLIQEISFILQNIYLNISITFENEKLCFVTEQR